MLADCVVSTSTCPTATDKCTPGTAAASDGGYCTATPRMVLSFYDYFAARIKQAIGTHETWFACRVQRRLHLTNKCTPAAGAAVVGGYCTASIRRPSCFALF